MQIEESAFCKFLIAIDALLTQPEATIKDLTTNHYLEALMRNSISKYIAGIRRCVYVFSCVALLLFATKVNSQNAGTGTIQGNVSDSSGALVANANVTLIELATAVKHETKTDKAGVYVFPNIPITTYNLVVTAPNFETYEQTGIVLEVGSNIAINVVLAVGRTDIKVEVHAEGLALQTEDSSFKQTIDQQDVQEMPLNGRQMTGLITLSGGSSSAPGGDFTGSKYSYQTISVSVAGGMGNTTAWKLDGGDNNDYMCNDNLPFPFPDAVSQFSVESSVLGAQGGMHSGGLVNVVTRSGTNAYHGSAFEFIRNNFVDATNFFSTSKDTLHQNQYGGTFGGHIIRDKLFGFFAYQHLKADQSASNTTQYVPTAANLAGDWSNTDPPPGAAKNNCGAPQQLFDPLTGAAIPGNKYPTPPTYNAAALALQKYLPVPIPSVDTYGCGTVTYAIPSQTSDDQYIGRVDYTINSKNNMYGRYLYDDYQSPSFFSPTNILITQNAPGNYERVQTLTVGEEWTITPTLVNSAHISGAKRVDLRQSAPGINASNIGITMYTAVPTGLQMTVSSSGKNHGWTAYCGTCAPGHYNDDDESFADDLTWVKGKHQMVVGGEYVQNQLNIVGAYESNGTFTFNGEYSGNGPTGSGGLVGDANLDFMWGSMSSFQQSKQQQNALRAPIPSLYFQDTFHASKRLTVVGGINWEPQFMPVDFYNRGSIFSMSQFLANQVSSVYPTAPAGSFFYGDNNVSRQFTQNSPWQFSPSAGASWDPFGDGKTVLRGGVSVAYDHANFFTGQRVNQNPPFATASSPATSSQLCFSEPWLVGGTGYGCSQVGGVNTSPYPQPPVPTKTQAVFQAQGKFIVLPTQFHPSDTLQWTISVQRQFGHGWQAQIDYIGNKTVNMPTGYPLNPAVFIPGVWGAAGTGCAGIVTTGPAAVKPGAAGTNCSTTGNQNSRFALTAANPLQGNQYSGGGGGSLIVDDIAWGNYNGMVATLQHRLSSTYSLLSNFTWSKCLNVTDAQGDISGTQVENPNNFSMDYGRCGSDYRKIFNTTLIAKSNFRLHGVTAYAVNNWELGPLFHIVSGGPINVTAGSDFSLTDVGNDRAVQIPGVNPYSFATIRSGAASVATRSYLNQAAFTQVTAPCYTGAGNTYVANGCAYLGTYGNIGRNTFSGPMSFQFDSQVSRIFPIKEKLSLAARLEAFNVLNHPSFSNPSSGGPVVGGGGSFGEISGTTIGARIFQGSLKVIF